MDDGPEGSSSSERPPALVPAPTGAAERRNDGTEPAARISPVEVAARDVAAEPDPGTTVDKPRADDDGRRSTVGRVAGAAAAARGDAPVGRSAPAVFSADPFPRAPTTANVLLRTGSADRAPATRTCSGAATLRRRSAG